MSRGASTIDAAKARHLILGWLARREHSRSEVLAKLRRKGCAPEIAEQAVAVLVREGLLSDERFAESLVRGRRRRGYGPVRIRRELEEKGLDAETVDRSVDVGAGDWLEEIERVRRRKFGDRPPQNFEERAKQTRFLQYRGFTYEQIQQVLHARRDEG